MVAASLMRRKQLLMQGYEDAFPQAVAPSGMTTVSYNAFLIVQADDAARWNVWSPTGFSTLGACYATTGAQQEFVANDPVAR